MSRLLTRFIPYGVVGGAVSAWYLQKSTTSQLFNLASLAPTPTPNETKPQNVCPIQHKKEQVSGVCPVKHESKAQSNSSTSSEGNITGTCPVKHDIKPTGVCPVKHESREQKATSANNSSNSKPTGQASHGYGLFSDKIKDGPSEGDDRYVDPESDDPYVSSESLVNIPYPHEIPGGRIPATGRGNSVDGSDWVNPTPSELFRALRRKKKYIEEHDAYAVAFIHSVVVDSTWDNILKYEDLHKDECDEVTLNRFEGKYGDLTIKTKLNDFIHRLTGQGELVPFDRHDWYVNRCGKEIRYIIDYYATEDIEGNNTYFVDCRPEPTLEGLYDRARLTLKSLREGQSFSEIW